MILTDRQRVELAIPARLVFGIVAANCFAPNPEADADEALAELERNVARLKELLTTACVEPIADLPERLGSKVARRIERVVDAAAKPFDDQPAVKVAMALYYFLEDLLSRGVLELLEGSAFAEAMGILMPMFEHGFSEEKLDRSAQKRARQLLEHLQREGYYRAPAQAAAA